jgi:Holliday junction resolvase-like predicted endonuclease
MAQLSPHPVFAPTQHAGLYRELDVLERLNQSLSSDHEIFHSVTWHNVDGGTDHHGEIDVVVLAPNGNVLLIEVKSGSLFTRDGALYKLYASGEHNVARQSRIQYGAIVNRLQKAGLRPSVINCVVLPDFRVDAAIAIIALPFERIIDASDYDNLGTRVRALLALGKSSVNVDAIRHFLRNEFRVEVDLSTMQTQLRRTVQYLSGGLATWVPRISVPSGCFRIEATAGSGKTQLALRLMQDAVSQQKTVLYVCFNRVLADHIAQIAPPRAQVANFHELCIDHFRRLYGQPDFSDKTVFEKAATAYVKDTAAMPARLDVLIVDEGQDFEPAWLESLTTQLKTDGVLYVMEDPNQRLYERTDFDLPDAVQIRCHDNFRSPRAVCDAINAFRLADTCIQSRNPYAGMTPEFHCYDSDVDVVARTAEAVERLLAQGFKIEDIVVLTARGRGKSVVQNEAAIGQHPTRHFTGQYTRGGDPVWTPGVLIVDSVYRYKGLSAPAVVLTELDFEEVTELVRHKLFVGMTRACLAVDLVMSRSAERALSLMLDD